MYSPAPPKAIFKAECISRKTKVHTLCNACDNFQTCSHITGFRSQEQHGLDFPPWNCTYNSAGWWEGSLFPWRPNSWVSSKLEASCGWVLVPGISGWRVFLAPNDITLPPPIKATLSGRDAVREEKKIISFFWHWVDKWCHFICAHNSHLGKKVRGERQGGEKEKQSSINKVSNSAQVTTRCSSLWSKCRMWQTPCSFHQSHPTQACHSVSLSLSSEWFLHLNLCIFYTKWLLNRNQHCGASLKKQNLSQYLLGVSKGHFDSNFCLLWWL